MDHPAIVHDVNVLTVVASESYKDFVAALQKDISDSLSARPKVADEAFFTGKVLKTATGDVEVTPQLAKQIYKYLLKNDYTDDADRITGTYHDAKKAETLAELPPELKPYAAQVYPDKTPVSRGRLHRSLCAASRTNRSVAQVHAGRARPHQGCAGHAGGRHERDGRTRGSWPRHRGRAVSSAVQEAGGMPATRQSAGFHAQTCLGPG